MNSLGMTTKIPRLSKGSTRKFRTGRSQYSFSSVPDVFADNESTKGQADLSVSEMKLRSEKNLDGDQERSAEAGGRRGTNGIERLFEPTLSRARTSNGRKSRGQRRPRSVPRSSLEKRYCSGEFANQRPRVISGEKIFHTRPIHNAKQSKNAMMSSISPSEEQTGSKAKKSWKSFVLTLIRKALSTSPTRPMSDGIALGVSSTFDRLMTSMGKQKGERSQAGLQGSVSATHDRRSKADESGWTLHRGPWPISDSDECGRY